jgi:hypothetical protein
MDSNNIKNGIQKIYWKDIRSKVKNVEPNFVKIVDELSPNQSFPLYLAFYPYGVLIADPRYMYLPKANNTVCTLFDESLPKDIINDLSYGKESWAMGIVLEKNIEVFIDFKDDRTFIPWLIYKPGTFFPYARTLSKKSEPIYAPNNILTIVSGVRSTFLLPKIECLTNHLNLKRDYQVQSPAPKRFYDHWKIFKEISNSESVSTHWRSCLLYFSEKWVKYLHNDRAWLNLKMYLHELAWQHFEYRRNSIYYDMAFSKIQKKRNLKPNPYLLDTASHLFTTASGAAPGYAPACNEDSLPLEILHEAYANSYGMTKYTPTIMQPTYFDFKNNVDPVYYSLQNPSTFVFSPKSRKIASTLYELHELEHIMKILIEELSNENMICSGTVISEAANNVEFKYFHNEYDRYHIVQLSSSLAEQDSRFNYVHHKLNFSNSTFASDAKFLRGCVRIKKN